MFRFTGGRLLHAVFPNCTEALTDGLGKIAARGESEDYDFVIHVLENYRGEPAMHDVVRQIVNALPDGDARFGRLAVVPRKHGRRFR